MVARTQLAALDNNRLATDLFTNIIQDGGILIEFSSHFVIKILRYIEKFCLSTNINIYENVMSSYQIARFLSHSSPLNVWFSQIVSGLLKEKTFPMLIPHQPVIPSPPPGKLKTSA